RPIWRPRYANSAAANGASEQSRWFRRGGRRPGWIKKFPPSLGGGGFPCGSACAGLAAELGAGFIREPARAIHASERPQKIVCNVVPGVKIQRVHLSVVDLRLFRAEILLGNHELANGNERRVFFIPLYGCILDRRGFFVHEPLHFEIEYNGLFRKTLLEIIAQKAGTGWLRLQ